MIGVRSPELAAEASRLRPELTVLSDLSANVFAALLLILVVLLQLKLLADRGSETPARAAPITADREPGAVERSPMGAGDLVSLLRRRGRLASGTSLDLGPEGVTVTHEGGTSTVPAAAFEQLEPLLRGAGAGERIRLFVFSNRHYAELAGHLRRVARTWDEISVPSALRDPSHDDRWSQAFLQLADGMPRADDFRRGLAEILAGGRGPLAPDAPIHGGSGSGPDPTTAGSASEGLPLLARLLRWAGVVVGTSALVLAACVVTATEWLVADRTIQYRPNED